MVGPRRYSECNATQAEAVRKVIDLRARLRRGGLGHAGRAVLVEALERAGARAHRLLATPPEIN
jgi:hypothetical protein